ncbi:MAG: bifunctional diaminohydroxyphosphoribosylaminopyrimidine deaminase/5-amino-6-(5-phosphoribosylamino)uracil reductase RibD [Sulfurovum sp.]|nr:bifunctional diaminohydroxyphosphoribosylaminopyrimidine deaminase/5-amino-6-(5-phosphoribosylamino)uracil reductase RibD [Sulfurovaceae bacterium]
MQLAIDKAWEFQGLTYPNPAVGAVVTYKNKIIAIEAHQKAGDSHAEVLALVEAYKSISNKDIAFNKFNAKDTHQFLRNLPKGYFSECEIFVTLEPCNHHGKTPSCALLLEHLNLKQLFIAIKDPIDGHSNGAKRLNNVTIGIKEKEAKELIEPFLIWQDRAFVLFKIAQSSNGRVSTNLNNGYLSSKESLIDVHKMREVCTKLLIGGETVRADSPTLDCRFIEASPPDIYIYSKKNNFNKEIPLFNVKNREVEIGDDLTFLEEASFIIVEGGEGMLKALSNKIDWILIYQTALIPYIVDRKNVVENPFEMIR